MADSDSGAAVERGEAVGLVPADAAPSHPPKLVLPEGGTHGG